MNIMKYKLQYHPQVIKVLSVYRQSCPGMAGIDDIDEMSNESGVHQMVWCHSDHGGGSTWVGWSADFQGL